jgi:hypothetical protein
VFSAPGRGREAKDHLVCGLFALRGQKRVFGRKLKFSHLNYELTRVIPKKVAIGVPQYFHSEGHQLSPLRCTRWQLRSQSHGKSGARSAGMSDTDSVFHARKN